MNECKPLADGSELSDSKAAEIPLFLEQHLTCYVNLFRTELQHLEARAYTRSHFFAQFELTSPLSAQLTLALSPM